jgi:hypothetical protein
MVSTVATDPTANDTAPLWTIEHLGRHGDRYVLILAITSGH